MQIDTAAICHLMCRSDIKIENVLKHLNGNWVLCDFGSAKPKSKTKINSQNAQHEQQEINRTTTPAYRAPEVTTPHSDPEFQIETTLFVI